MKDQRIRDAVHGLITFRAASGRDMLAWRLINTVAFQRLRRIKQLGVTEYVYPSATHTRFAHCVGVFHTARHLVELIRREVGTEFDESRGEVATIAALLHDLGHGPFSHTFENVQKARGVAKRHELWTAEIIRDPEMGVSNLLRAYKPEIDFCEQVATLLESEDPVDLYHAVVSSSFDADRLDYLRRDRLMTGIGAGAIDFDWLMEHVRVREVEIEAPDLADIHEDAPAIVQTFCLDLKALPAAEQFLLARYTLHQQVYFHKTTRCMEAMISRLLKYLAELARTPGKVAQDAGLLPDHPLWNFFSKADPSVTDYVLLDDVTVLAAFEAMTRALDPEVATLAERLRDRRLFKTLDLNAFGHDEGRQRMAARRIDLKRAERAFQGAVLKDEDAAISIYTQIGGDDDKMHKKLHIVDAQGPREITEHSEIITTLVQRHGFTRYYFEHEADRTQAAPPRGG